MRNDRCLANSSDRRFGYNGQYCGKTYPTRPLAQSSAKRHAIARGDSVPSCRPSIPSAQTNDCRGHVKRARTVRPVDRRPTERGSAQYCDCEQRVPDDRYRWLSGITRSFAARVGRAAFPCADGPISPLTAIRTAGDAKLHAFQKNDERCTNTRAAGRLALRAWLNGTSPNLKPLALAGAR